MARYKIVDRSPKFLPVVLDAQRMAGSFEYALGYLIPSRRSASRPGNPDAVAPSRRNLIPDLLLKGIAMTLKKSIAHVTGSLR